jgi:hypothetical protein
MQYFDKSEDKLQRIGKVIGDIFSAALIGTLIIVFASHMLSH